MTIFDVFYLFGGLALFLYGMNVMSASLEKLAGNKMKAVLGSMTSNPFKGFLLGLGVTAIIQSSSATTVMVVGFVNSGLMTLLQATGVIMGANLGTSVTSWLLSTTGITGEGTSFILSLLKPSTFTPILAFIGMLLACFSKKQKRKNIGSILIGFAILMFGMDFMSSSVAGLKEVPEFINALTAFENPLLGLLVGTVFTAIIQSSSASVGILQALTLTGTITCATAVPVIMGQNIGTCVSAMISSIGASKNAKRAAVIHLLFNILATMIILPVYYIVVTAFNITAINTAVNPMGIAILHTGFKIVALAILMPCSKLLVKLACKFVPDSKTNDKVELLDDRLLATPSVAIQQCRLVTLDMAKISVLALKESINTIFCYDEKTSVTVRDYENKADIYEDKLGTYLVKVSALDLTENDSVEVNKLLHIIGDFERISDHAVNILESAEEIKDKKMIFSDSAKAELTKMTEAVAEILDLALESFESGDLSVASKVEPLEQVVDHLKDRLKAQHIFRLQKGECTIELGFVLSDLITNLERVSDHCSNIAGCMIELSHKSMDMHEYLKELKDGSRFDYNAAFEYFKNKYSV